MEMMIKALGEQHTLTSKNNIIKIHGANNCYKTVLANEIYSYGKKHQNMIDDLKQLQNVFLISDDFDFKKEFSLTKTSNLRKEILFTLITEIESYNYDFIARTFDNKELNELINKITEKQFEANIETKEFNFLIQNKITSPTDVVDNLFDLKIIDSEGEEINLLKTSTSDLYKIYLSLRINTINKTKDNLIIFDNLDSIFDLKNKIWFKELIIKLSKENRIVLLSSDINFLKLFSYDLNDLYFLTKEQELFSLKFSHESIIKLILIEEFLLDDIAIEDLSLTFEAFVEKSRILITEEDFQIKIRKIIQNYNFELLINVLNNFVKLDNLKLQLEQFSDFYKLFVFLFLKQNYFPNLTFPIDYFLNNKIKKIMNLI